MSLEASLDTTYESLPSKLCCQLPSDTITGINLSSSSSDWRCKKESVILLLLGDQKQLCPSFLFPNTEVAVGQSTGYQTHSERVERSLCAQLLDLLSSREIDIFGKPYHLFYLKVLLRNQMLIRFYRPCQYTLWMEDLVCYNSLPEPFTSNWI